MRFFVSYGDIKAIQTVDKMWYNTCKLSNKNFFPSSKSKCKRTCGVKKIMLLQNYLHTNQTNTNKNNDNDVRWRKLNIIYQVNYLLRAKIHIHHYSHIPQ